MLQRARFLFAFKFFGWDWERGGVWFENNIKGRGGNSWFEGGARGRPGNLIGF